MLGNHSLIPAALVHLGAAFNKHRKQIALAVRVILFHISGQTCVHTTATHIWRVRHNHIVLLPQRFANVNQLFQLGYRVCQTEAVHRHLGVLARSIGTAAQQSPVVVFHVQDAAVLFRVRQRVQQPLQLQASFVALKIRKPVAEEFQLIAVDAVALLYRIDVRVQMPPQETAVVVAALHHHDKIRHLRGAVVDVQTVEVMLHNAGGGVTVGIARAAVNLHQHIKQIRQNMPAAHAGVDALYILRRQGGVTLAQLCQLLRHLRLLRGFVQIILPLGFIKIRVTLAPQAAKAVFDHVPHDPVRRKQLGGSGDVLFADFDVLFEVGEHLLFRLGVVILVQPANNLHSVLPVGFRDVVYQMADHAVLIREGERQQQRHIVVHLLKQAGQAVAQRGALL